MVDHRPKGKGSGQYHRRLYAHIPSASQPYLPLLYQTHCPESELLSRTPLITFNGDLIEMTFLSNSIVFDVLKYIFVQLAIQEKLRRRLAAFFRHGIVVFCQTGTIKPSITKASNVNPCTI